MTVLYGDELKAVGAFLAGLQQLCLDTKVDVCAEEDGIALYFEGEIVGHVGMHEDTAYSFKPYAGAST